MPDRDPTTVDLTARWTDETTQAIAELVHAWTGACPCGSSRTEDRALAEQILAGLADAGRLLPEGGQTREEYKVTGVAFRFRSLAEARRQLKHPAAARSAMPYRRIVTDFADGSTFTSPWEPVPDTTTEGATP